MEESLLELEIQDPESAIAGRFQRRTMRKCVPPTTSRERPFTRRRLFEFGAIKERLLYGMPCW